MVMEVRKNKIILQIILIYSNIGYYGQNQYSGIKKPKAPAKNQVTEKERLEAEAALRSLKQKISNSQKKPVRQNNKMQGYGFNQNNKKVNNNMNMNYGMDYNMDFGMDDYNIGGTHNPMPKKPIAKQQ